VCKVSHEIHEECGVFGIYAPRPYEIAPTVYSGLYALQHRGQEGCGIVVHNGRQAILHKDTGLVGEVFTPEALRKFGPGHMALGHVRYGTTGNSDRANVQPMLTKHAACNMAVAHNGNLVNAATLRLELEQGGAIFHTTSDTELISYEITRQCLAGVSYEEAVSRAMDVLEGAYSLVLLFDECLVAARDKHGFRPLCYGLTEQGEYVVASESCALDAVNATLIRDVRPGEIVVFDQNGVRSLSAHCGGVKPAPCIFEYIYFARPDSVIDGCAVHRARLQAGRFLAKEHPVEADIVIGVPDSGIDAAIGYAAESGIPYGIGFIKNKYIGRTFIAPGQSSREQLVRIKLNPIAETVRGKRVVMIDDSIVRGTTSARIIRLLREAGAVEIHVRVSAPPFLHPCYYGTDVDSKSHLVANNHSLREICELIGADSLGYLPIGYLPYLLGEAGDATLCDACFTGDYRTALPADRNLDRDKFER